MTATITGVGSGFDIDSWVSQLVEAKRSTMVEPLETKLSTLETRNSAVGDLKSKFETLKEALQAFTNTVYNSSTDMWCKTKINSTNETYVTATSTGNISCNSVDIEVEQIATATTAKSVNSLGTVSNAASARYVNLANGQTKTGTFSMFLNGKEYNIEIEETDTLSDIMDKISSETGGKIQAKLEDGNFKIAAYKRNGYYGWQEDTSAVLTLGSSGDESNLATALKMNTKTGTHKYTSSYPLSLTNTDKAITNSESGLSGVILSGPDNTGVITINGEDFEINSNTTLNSLIADINANSEAGVSASYDSLTNKFILTSTTTGENNISLSETNTNLLNVLQLTSGSGANEKIADNSQTLGQNAIVYVNGNKVISTSNTVTGESSGISNLSFTVKKQTSAYSGDPDDLRKITLDIEHDYSTVKESLKTFVDAYNDVVSTAREYNTSTGAIGTDSSLSSIIAQIRSITTTLSEDNGGSYTLLSQIGISTSSKDITSLTIDETKLDEALSKNADSVKLLLSDGRTSRADTGLFDGLLETINGTLDTTNGYFTNKTNTLDSLISSMNNRIERANTRLTNYETRITKQFNKMDSVIASLNSQLTTFQSYIGTNSSN